jgi:large subunit ribosomal protein L20
MMKLCKGYFGRKKNVWTVAKNQLERSWKFAYIGRKLNKRNFRSIWIQRINAAARANGTSYSKLMHSLKQANIQLNRKVLADLAANHPAAFLAVLNQTK